MTYTNQHLEAYANCGLRTLLLAEKEITENYYMQWSQEYK